VMALILISVMDHDLIRSPGLAHVEPSPSSPSTLGTAGSRVAQDAAPDPVLAGWLTHALAGWLAGSRLLSTEARSPFSPPSLLSPWGEEERRWHGSNLRHAAVHFRPPAPGEPDRDRAAGGGGQENGTSGPGGRADGVARGATPGRLTW
jgi:hypothetical protein